MLRTNKSTNVKEEKSPCHYESDAFPGLIYHTTKPELTTHFSIKKNEFRLSKK